MIPIYCLVGIRTEDMVQVLLRDQFVDMVDNVQIRVYIQQAHVQILQEALARGLELELILQSYPRKVILIMTRRHRSGSRGGLGGPPPRSDSSHLQESFEVTVSGVDSQVTAGDTAPRRNREGPPRNSTSTALVLALRGGLCD